MIDSTGYARLLAEQPFLYHRVWDATRERLASIFEHGLERVDSHYQEHWASRPGHVYLATARGVNSEHLDKLRMGGCAVLRVRTAALTPSRINPDEDHFLPFNPLDLGVRNLIAEKHALQHFHRPWPPIVLLREWADYLGLAPLPSLGEWAEQAELGEDPAETRYSILKGSLAYQGVVPPYALTLAAQ